MWKQFLDLVRQVFSLAEDTQKNKTDLKELRQDLKASSEKSEKNYQELKSAIERLAYEIHGIGQREEAERKILRLELENQLLRAERRLPPARTRGDENLNQ
jgi:predicted  nucleic acid-binding Zn-ribbon protein